MKPIGKRLAVELTRELLRAKEAATMERMNVQPFAREGLAITVPEINVDTFIREKTRLYRETWIIARIDRVIAHLEAAINHSKG